MEALNRFNEDFNEIVDITYNTYWGIPLVYKKAYSRALEKTVSDILKDKEHLFDLTIEDLRQQVCLFWLKYEKQYEIQKEKNNVTLITYLIRRSIWGIRDWLHKNNSSLRVDLRAPVEDKDPIGFKLNINFLLKGSSNNLLKNLSGYERYIIFLVFKEGKNFVEMSKILQRDRASIKEHYKNIIEKVRKNNDETLKKRNN